MSTRLLGNAEILYIWDGTDTYEPVICLTSNSFSDTNNIVEAVTKCSNGETDRDKGSHSYEISFEGLYVQPETDKTSWAELRTKLRSLDSVTWKIETTYPNASTDVEYGTAIFSDLEKTSTTQDEHITFSGTLQGSGAITSTDPNA